MISLAGITVWKKTAFYKRREKNTHCISGLFLTNPEITYILAAFATKKNEKKNPFFFMFLSVRFSFGRTLAGIIGVVTMLPRFTVSQWLAS